MSEFTLAVNDKILDEIIIGTSNGEFVFACHLDCVEHVMPFPRPVNGFIMHPDLAQQFLKCQHAGMLKAEYRYTDNKEHRLLGHLNVPDVSTGTIISTMDYCEPGVIILLKDGLLTEARNFGTGSAPDDDSYDSAILNPDTAAKIIKDAPVIVMDNDGNVVNKKALH